MTKRNLAAFSLTFTAAVLLLGERAAFSSETLDALVRPGDGDQLKTAPLPPKPGAAAAPTAPAGVPPTIWDLLRTGDPLNKRPAQPTALTIRDAVRNGQPGIDPRTGRPIVAPAKIRKKRVGVYGFFDSMHDTFQKVGKTLHSDIKVTGNSSLGVHKDSVAGSAQSYQNDTYFGQRGVGGSYSNTDLTVTGKILGLVNFETRYTNNPYGNPYDNRLSLNYASKHFKLDAGDITGSITGNSLIDFSRTLKGIEVGADILRGVKTTILVSQTKAIPRTVTLNGTNGPGPYFIYAGQVVDGTVHVRVNNRDMTLLKDYTLDLYTGELKFTAGTIINPQDVIAVSFETYGYNQSPGTLMGIRTDFKLFKGSKLGVTMLSQNNSQANSTPAAKTDQFFGYANPLTPYTLQFPVEMVIVRNSAGQITSATPRYPVTATVGGTPQVYSVDFQVDPNLPNRVFFAQAIPSTQIIRITYTPQTTNETPGNRRVIGLDSVLPLGKFGNMTAEWANSMLDLAGKNVSGGAFQLRGDMRFLKDKLHANFNLRNINPDFTSIESVGFQRNEKGITMGFDWLLSKALKLNATMEKTKRPSYDFSSLATGGTSGFASSTGLDDFTQINFGMNYQLGKAGQINLTHTNMNTLLAAGGATRFGTDSISMAYNFKSLGADLQLSKNTNFSSAVTPGAAAASAAAQTATTGVTPTGLSTFGGDSLSQRVNLRWRASEFLTFSGIVANSNVKGATGQNNNAKDMQLNAEVKPMRSMTFRLGYQLSDSGGYSIYGTPTTPATTGTTTPAATTPAATTPAATTPAASGSSGAATTGTGSSALGTGANGLPVLAPTRQVATPTGSGLPNTPLSTGLGSTGYYNGLGSTLGTGSSYLGGGYNSNLGGSGNYSGGFYSPTFGSGFAASGFGGKSRTINASLDYQPAKSLNLNFTWNQSSSAGDYQFNSNRNDIGLNLTYSLGERLTFSSAFTNQKVTYVGNGGGTSTNMMFLNMRSRPIGKLVTTLGFQIMRTGGSVNQTALGTTNGIPTTSTTGSLYGTPSYGSVASTLTPGFGAGSTGNPYQLPYSSGVGSTLPGTGLSGLGLSGTNMTSYSLRLEYPVFHNNNIFFQFDNAGSTGYLASIQRTMVFGFNFALTQNMQFVLGWRNQDHISQGTAAAGGNYTYHARSLDADVNMHF